MREPVETYATNVMGTVHLLEAARRAPGVKAIVCVTSDKCYENREWVWPYRESDPMGGHDPYSSSKGVRRAGRGGVSQLVLRADGPAARHRCAPAMSSAAATGRAIGWCPTSSAPSRPAPRR